MVDMGFLPRLQAGYKKQLPRCNEWFQ